MDMLHTSEVMAIVVIFDLFWPKIGFHGNVLRPLQSEMSSLDPGTPVISNRILVISRRNAFIAILVPKLVAMATPFCPLYTGVSQMNFPIAH